MTTATANTTEYIGQHGETIDLAMEFQCWILHLAHRPVNCRCAICRTVLIELETGHHVH